MRNSAPPDSTSWFLIYPSRVRCSSRGRQHQFGRRLLDRWTLQIRANRLAAKPQASRDIKFWITRRPDEPVYLSFFERELVAATKHWSSPSEQRGIGGKKHAAISTIAAMLSIISLGLCHLSEVRPNEDFKLTVPWSNSRPLCYWRILRRSSCLVRLSSPHRN